MNVLQKEFFPESQKIASLTPIFKKGDPKLTSKYRAICSLPDLSNITEKLINSRFITYLNKHQLLDENQIGFQKYKSTENTILSLIEKLYDAFNKKEYSLAVFVYYQKAFDIINHFIFQNKLHRYGKRDNVLNLIKQFYLGS